MVVGDPVPADGDDAADIRVGTTAGRRIVDEVGIRAIERTRSRRRRVGPRDRVDVAGPVADVPDRGDHRTRQLVLDIEVPGRDDRSFVGVVAQLERGLLEGSLGDVRWQRRLVDAEGVVHEQRGGVALSADQEGRHRDDAHQVGHGRGRVVARVAAPEDGPGAPGAEGQRDVRLPVVLGHVEQAVRAVIPVLEREVLLEGSDAGAVLRVNQCSSSVVEPGELVVLFLQAVPEGVAQPEAQGQVRAEADLVIGVEVQLMLVPVAAGLRRELKLRRQFVGQAEPQVRGDVGVLVRIEAERVSGEAAAESPRRQ